jgi:hypothetical protein
LILRINSKYFCYQRGSEERGFFLKAPALTEVAYEYYYKSPEDVPERYKAFIDNKSQTEKDF